MDLAAFPWQQTLWEMHAPLASEITKNVKKHHYLLFSPKKSPEKQLGVCKCLQRKKECNLFSVLSCQFFLSRLTRAIVAVYRRIDHASLIIPREVPWIRSHFFRAVPQFPTHCLLVSRNPRNPIPAQFPGRKMFPVSYICGAPPVWTSITYCWINKWTFFLCKSFSVYLYYSSPTL